MAHSGEKSVEIDVPAEDFYRIITDFEAYPRFLRSVLSSNMLQREGEVYDVEFTVRVIKKIDYTLRLEGKPYESVTWHLSKPGLFKTNDGGWRLEWLSDTKIRAYYRLSVSMAAFVPKAITNRLVAYTLPEMLQQFKEHAEAQYQSKLQGTSEDGGGST